MYKYEFVEVSYSFSGLGLGNGHRYDIDSNICEIINEKAKKGFKYSGFIPITQRGTGIIEKITLIFEKEEINK